MMTNVLWSHAPNNSATVFRTLNVPQTDIGNYLDSMLEALGPKHYTFNGCSMKFGYLDPGQGVQIPHCEEYGLRALIAS